MSRSTIAILCASIALILVAACMCIELGVDYLTIGHGLMPQIAFPAAACFIAGAFGVGAYLSYKLGHQDGSIAMYQSFQTLGPETTQAMHNLMRSVELPAYEKWHDTVDTCTDPKCPVTGMKHSHVL